jgi:hypothetical protein
LNHTILVGGDAGKIGAIENRALQSAGFKQGFLAPGIGSRVGKGRIVRFFKHG